MKSYNEWLNNEIKSRMYDSLEEIGAEFADVDEELLEKLMKENFEWFLVHFFG